MSATRTDTPTVPAARRPDHRGSWLPTGALITTKLLELRRRRGLMAAVIVLTLGLPFLVLGFRLLFHAVDPNSYGPAGSPTVFQGLVDPIGQFGFIIAAALGATAGTSDLTDGLFRHLVITGRSRVALYLARIPAGLAILVPLVAVGFAALCLVTAFEGTPQPTSVNEFGGNIPLNLSQPQLESYLLAHPGLVQQGFGPGPGPGGKGALQSSPSSAALVRSNIGSFYQTYLTDQASQRNPAANEMAKIGLWLELEVGLGFMIGLGLGSLTGQRTVTVIILIALQVILTPILAGHVIPYFLDGQRVVVGVAMDQLRPAGLASVSGLHGPGRAILGGRGALEIPPMPTWAMITDIVGWIVGWSVIGAWRMATRDA